MCLATVYKESDNTVICRNVSRMEVEGEFVRIRDILGEETRVQRKKAIFRVQRGLNDER